MKRRKFIKITLPLAFMGMSQAAESGDSNPVIGVIADPQYADVEPRGSRFYRNSLAKLSQAVDEMNRVQPSFVVTVGDLIDRDFKSFADVMPIYAKLKSPHFIVLGNHDFTVDDADKEKVHEAVGLKEPYYSKEGKGWKFIFLDGTDVATFRYPKGDSRSEEAKQMLKKARAEGKSNAKYYNGAIGDKQMRWLEKELDSAKFSKQKVLIFNHYPVIPEGNFHNLLNSEELVELIGKYDHVAAYFSGHNHSGNYGTHKGTHYVNLKGMVETESDSAYAIVRCLPDRLELEGYGMEPDRDLKKL